MKISLPATHGHKADPFSAKDPTRAASVDWAKTMEFWHYQAGRGLGIAEAMNAARRGMGLDWPGAVEMIHCTKAELPEAWVANRCGTDHLNLTDVKILNDLRRALVRMAKWPQDYVSVYSDMLAACDHRVILHGLGDMSAWLWRITWEVSDLEAAMETALAMISANKSKVGGITISLMEKDKEILMRRRLLAAVRMYSGDDFNYPALI